MRAEECAIRRFRDRLEKNQVPDGQPVDHALQKDGNAVTSAPENREWMLTTAKLVQGRPGKYSTPSKDADKFVGCRPAVALAPLTVSYSVYPCLENYSSNHFKN